MTVRKGEPWGGVGPAPAGAVIVRDDAESNRVVAAALDAGRPVPPLALLGGDLMRSLGGTGDRSRLAGEVAILPVDLLRVEVEGRVGWACSHVVVRHRSWRGEIVLVMNGQYLGDWDVAPRAHPGDGRADVVTVDRAMGWRDRLRARRRLPHGLHLPHPAITVRQVTEVDRSFDDARRVYVDGECWGSSRSLHVRVEPGLVTAVV